MMILVLIWSESWSLENRPTIVDLKERAMFFFSEFMLVEDKMKHIY